MKLRIQKLHYGATVPVYATDGAACFDLHAAIVNGNDMEGDYVTPDQPMVEFSGEGKRSLTDSAGAQGYASGDKNE